MGPEQNSNVAGYGIRPRGQNHGISFEYCIKLNRYHLSLLERHELLRDDFKRICSMSDFLPLSQTTRSWVGMAAAPNGNVYACVYGGGIYMQTNGIGNFVTLNQTTRYWVGMCAASNGDVYACTTGAGGDIYKQTNGARLFGACVLGL